MNRIRKIMYVRGKRDVQKYLGGGIMGRIWET